MPFHLFPKQTTLDAFAPSQFVGKALVVDCHELGAGERITLEHITRYGDAAESAEFLLFYTGWDLYWNEPTYFGDYPYLSEKAVEYIYRSKKKGVGLDVIGIDPIADETLTIHRKLLADGNFVIIENLTNLSELAGKSFLFAALPLKFENADGAPIRAVAILD